MDQFVIADAEHMNARSQILLLIGSNEFGRHSQARWEIRFARRKILRARHLGSALKCGVPALEIITFTHSDERPLLSLKRMKDRRVGLNKRVPFHLDGIQTLQYIGFRLLHMYPLLHEHPTMVGKRFRKESAMALRYASFPSSESPSVFRMRCFLEMSSLSQWYST